MLIKLILLIGLTPFTFGDETNKPLLQELWAPKNLAENKTVRLNCNLIQGNSVKFEWYLNDQKLESNVKRRIVFNEESSELVFKSLSAHDLGTYRCVAKNEFGEDNQNVSLFFNGMFFLLKFEIDFKF